MNVPRCPYHPDYDGLDEPPDPRCQHCAQISRAYGPGAGDEED